MTVYVDDFRARYGRMVMSHMLADSTRELLDMADLLGLRRDWLQHPGQPDEHFDVSLGYRRRAIALGAREVTSRELVEIIRARRERLRTAPCRDCGCYGGTHLPVPHGTRQPV